MVYEDYNVDQTRVLLPGLFRKALKESGLRSFPLFSDTQMRIFKINGVPVVMILWRELEVEKLIEVDFIATAENYKRKGLASKLLRTLHISFPEVWLEVSENNHAAIEFYGSLGYKGQGRRKTYYLDGSDALKMCRSLETSSIKLDL